jgi:hypothetical protein
MRLSPVPEANGTQRDFEHRASRLGTKHNAAKLDFTMLRSRGAISKAIVGKPPVDRNVSSNFDVQAGSGLMGSRVAAMERIDYVGDEAAVKTREAVSSFFWPVRCLKAHVVRDSQSLGEHEYKCGRCWEGGKFALHSFLRDT